MSSKIKFTSPCIETASIIPQPLTVTFQSRNASAGRLFENAEGKLEFEGDVEESAKTFFTYVCDNFPVRTAGRQFDYDRGFAAGEAERETLQVTIAQQVAEIEQLKGYERIHLRQLSELSDLGLRSVELFEALKKERDQLKLGLERLKGGQGEPVAYVLTRDNEVCYEADDGIVISNTPGDETNLYKWKPVYFGSSLPIDALDEHSAFEGQLSDKLMGNRYGERFIRDSYGIYRDAKVRSLWMGWQERANLANHPARSVNLPERKEHVHQGLSHTDARTDGWNACLDQLKELNQ